MLDSNTAYQVSKEDFKVSVSAMQNMIPNNEPSMEKEIEGVRNLNATLHQVIAKVASEQVNQRRESNSDNGKAWLLQTITLVVSMNPNGRSKVDTLNYWLSLIDTEVRPIAIFALEILSIPATIAPIERIFSQAGMATARHRNHASQELLNCQLVVYCNNHDLSM